MFRPSSFRVVAGLGVEYQTVHETQSEAEMPCQRGSTRDRPGSFQFERSARENGAQRIIEGRRVFVLPQRRASIDALAGGANACDRSADASRSSPMTITHQYGTCRL